MFAIISTQYGTLCGTKVNSTAEAAQAAWVGVQKAGRWAQSGWSKCRGWGNFVYIECSGDSYFQERFPAPSNGSTQRYYVLQENSGIWYFIYSGEMLGECSDAYWIRNKGMGSCAQYCGEIFNREDDMPGTEATPCTFRNLAYATNYGSLTSLSDPSLSSSDKTRWSFKKISTGFDMWDNCPSGDGSGI